MHRSCLFVGVAFLCFTLPAHAQGTAGRTVHTYYVAADEVEMETVDMIPGDPGIWMHQSHFEERMQAGIMALYKVEP